MNRLSTLDRIILGIVGVLLATTAWAFLFTNTFKADASVVVGNEYTISTTTRSFAGVAMNNLQNLTGTTTAKTGVFGSFLITGANTGVIYLWDATTSDVTQRAPSMSSSTILLATFPASAAAQSYPLEVAFKRGVLVESVGSIATGTMLYRIY